MYIVLNDITLCRGGLFKGKLIQLPKLKVRNKILVNLSLNVRTSGKCKRDRASGNCARTKSH